MKKFTKTPLSMTVGMMISVSCVGNIAYADNNPFKLTELSEAGIQMARVVPTEASETSATAKAANAPAEMKCGAMMNEKSDDHAGDTKGAGEMKCGAMMNGKSGDQMGDMKGSGEMSCGAMMKKMSGMSNEEKKAMCMKMMMSEKQSHQ